MCDLFGLARREAGGWRLLTTRDGLPHNRVRWATVEKDGGLWAATAGGLAYLKDQRIHRVTTRDGLPENYLRLVLDDELGHLCVASMGRIFRLDKRELLDLFAGRATRIHPVLFDTFDGLRSTEGLLSNGPGFRAADGRLWFATAKGVSVIDPARVSVDDPAPRVTIERWTVDGRAAAPARLPAPGTIVAASEYPPGRGEVTIEYTAPSYRSGRKTRFRHRLAGLDQDWVEAGSARRAYYSNLPPGSYRFSVMASNPEGLWNGEEAALTFTIRPPLHATPLFYAACAAAALGLGALVHRVRVRRMRARFSDVVQGRTRIARELHDTLAQDLRMPGIGGVAAITAICREDPEARIIVLTIHKGDEAVYQAIRAGARGYLLKDVSFEELLAAIRTVHGGGQCIPPEIALKMMERIRQETLTAREVEVLKLAAGGLANKEIAGRLGVAESTVKHYVVVILAKLGARDRTHAVSLAIERNIIDIQDVDLGAGRAGRGARRSSG